MMMAFRINRAGGIYKKGSACGLSKRMQVIKSAILNGGNIAETARDNFLTYQGTKNIITRYQQQLTARADVGGHFQREIMKDYVQLYIKLLVVQSI